MNRINTKKILIVIVTVLLLVGRGPFIAMAQSTPPEPPTPPEAPEAPEAPEPSEYNYPTASVVPTPPPNPYINNEEESFNEEPNTNNHQESSTGSEDSGGDTSSGQVGDSEIVTGDAETVGNITTNGNNNYSTGEGDGNSAAVVVNEGNGAFSDNVGSASVVNDDNTVQENSATVSNTMDEASVTGDNATSFNVGDSSTTTGDANTTGTIVTAVNTNVDGIAVAEFNIVDDHVGDIILDFGEGCVSGCGNGSASVENTNNGAGSDNFAISTDTTNSSTTQINDADVESNLILLADSGNNDASFNTGGDSSITTGDANVSGNVLTFANNNIIGDVVYGVVNIFGDLVGDIVLTGEALGAICGGCGGAVNAENSDNGANSNNIAVSDSTVNDVTFQNNDATIENNLILDSTTGDNSTSFNTDGDSSVTTGESEIDANVLNVANMNINGGDLWLVIVNEAGKWIGRIMGSPDGSNYAGSEEIEFVIDDNGDIIATNSGNGAGSNNFSSADSTVNNTTVQDNTANVVNNVDLSANTGGNTSSFNTGGESDIVTGDATVIANIVNFVNNNIVGDGTLVVTVVNVFGSWIGDFVGPGMEKEVGGVVAYNEQDSFDNYDNSNNSSSESGSNNDNGSADASGQQDGQESTPAQVIGTTTAAFNASAAYYGYSFRDGSGSDGINEIVGGVAKVQAASTTIDTQTASDKVVKINFAWFVIFGGLILLYVVLGRVRKSLAKANSNNR